MLNTFIKDFIREEDGQDLVEYSLLLAFIALGLVATMGTLKNSIGNLWNKMSNSIGNVTNSVT